MASTRNKNSKGNYKLEKLEDKKTNDYIHFKEFGKNQIFQLPDLYNPSSVPSCELSKNFTDVESYLRGTHSTDLEDFEKNTFFNPIYKEKNYISFFEREKVALPEPLVIETQQRPSIN